MGSLEWSRLHGLFAVYKPPGLNWKHLRDTVEFKLLKGLNLKKQYTPKEHIRFLLAPKEESEEGELTLIAKSVPALSEHSLVLGVGRGNKLLTDIYNAHLTKDYTVRGLLGKATDDFSDEGRLIEKTTYDHVTPEKLSRILAVIQGSHQKAMVTYSNLDLKTQEAYEMAVKGLIRPMDKSPMLITGIRCLKFAPPEFLLEIQCMHETQQLLRRVVHEIGLELKSSAVCTQVRRTRDGVFTLEDALLRTQWNIHNIQTSIQKAAPRVEAELEKCRTVALGHPDSVGQSVS
ncbi:pseudouridylate synthase TRUB2, mitochondrial isoform X2 [Antechinus flavipes]|uniref:pseudouridylate synthase TRUB2, mitochondrial isoform X2 n=1 Tax=Antechinus flavipes TaxID=38775 RepID=UPI0022369876|nr:pseudouridylate synthase TRUB2, mitochondrial isoform X2 [Antechinus flavipes]